MAVRRYITEASGLAPKNDDGSYDVTIITSGEGSSGRYSEALLEASTDVFAGAPSFINHPVDPNKPHQRDLNTIGGRLSPEVRVVKEDGVTKLKSRYTPRKEYASLFEEFGDIIGLSIFCGAEGEVMEDGRLDVSAFDDTDPYRSVDAVVAAGRGGRFERAAESLRVIESSLGKPANKRTVEASAGEKEGKMDEKVLEAIAALTESLKPIIAFVNESKEAGDKSAQAQVDAEAVESAVTKALSTYDEKVVAIEAAELLEPQVEELRALAREGKDITKSIESAKKVVEAAKKRVTESSYTVSEGADEDWSVNL